MPKVIFTADDLRDRNKIETAGTYDLTITGIKDNELTRDGYAIWNVAFSTDDGLTHYERFDFNPEYSWKLRAFVSACGWNATAGEHELELNDFIGESLKVDIGRWQSKDGSKSGWQVKKWHVPTPAALDAKIESAKPVSKLAKL